MSQKPVALIILDGYGISSNIEGNAVAAANTPIMDALVKNYPNTTLKTSGLDVGLPDGQMGNSEVGHTNIGAGRIVYQELTRISKSIEDKEFYFKEEFITAIQNVKQYNSRLHLLGLLSDGGVHSHNSHLYALLQLAKQHNVKEVFVHCFTDGRDVSPTSGKGYIEELQAKMKEIGVGKIATIVGRYYAMDRDNRWERVKRAYDAMVLGRGNQAIDPTGVIHASYEKQVFDEFVEPTVLTDSDRPVATIAANDSILFFNFRPDRARQITRAFVDPTFTEFNREKGYFPNHYVCMTQYDKTFPNVSVAFKPQSMKHTLGEYVSQQGLRQLRVAETEKYPHVTFFFNGGVETVYPGEDRILVPSPKVATYDMQPEMSAFEVTSKVVHAVKEKIYDLIILNFANPDMVGHTGDFNATKKAVEAVDQCLGNVVDALLSEGGIVLVTADHGNAEQMIDYVSGGPMTAHTTNVVPLILIGMNNKKMKEGRLADLAPTILEILGLDQPVEMSGISLLE